MAGNAHEWSLHHFRCKWCSQTEGEFLVHWESIWLLHIDKKCSHGIADFLWDMRTVCYLLRTCTDSRVDRDLHYFHTNNPEKNLSSQLTHCKLTWKLTASSFWSHLSTSQLINQMMSNCDLDVGPLWICISHRELAVSYLWDQPMSSPCSGSSELSMISLLTSQWATQVSPQWVWR